MKMNKAVYDTRFFAESYYSKDESTLKKLRAQKARKERYVSAVVIHEIYRLALSREGRETARTKVAHLRAEFEVVPVDNEIAQISAELRHKYQLSMGDSMIAATASVLKAVCISDDPHFKEIKEIETAWI
jgi:predicted nucleic acid-binding protein